MGIVNYSFNYISFFNFQVLETIILRDKLVTFSNVLLEEFAVKLLKILYALI